MQGGGQLVMVTRWAWRRAQSCRVSGCQGDAGTCAGAAWPFCAGAGSNARAAWPDSLTSTSDNPKSSTKSLYPRKTLIPGGWLGLTH